MSNQDMAGFTRWSVGDKLYYISTGLKFTVVAVLHPMVLCPCADILKVVYDSVYDSTEITIENSADIARQPLFNQNIT